MGSDGAVEPWMREECLEEGPVGKAEAREGTWAGSTQDSCTSVE